MLQESDRRILAHLSEPRSLANLTRVLRADDFAPFDADASFESVQTDVRRALAQLVDEGLVVTLGSHPDAKSMLRAVADHKQAIDIPKVKATVLRERLDAGRDTRLQTGDLVVLSTAGLNALTA